MTKVEVQPGVCGFTCTITAERREDGLIAVVLETECGLCRELGEAIAVVDPMRELYGRGGPGVVRQSGRCHAPCLVPAGVLKAVEAESGLALPRDASIRFLNG